jgi:methylase of polypeptide subunit release factors
MWKRGVLIPRPETEVLVEHFLAVAPPQGVILDLGIGSGILAITILLERPNYIAFGVDISKEALKGCPKERKSSWSKLKVIFNPWRCPKALQGKTSFHSHR